MALWPLWRALLLGGLERRCPNWGRQRCRRGECLGPPAKRARSASDIIRELTELQGPFNASIIDGAEANTLKAEITAELGQPPL